LVIRRSVCMAILVALFAGGGAFAHVVFGTITLRLLTLQADVVARVRIVDAASLVELEDPPLRETVVVAEVLERLKGRIAEDAHEGTPRELLRFVQHGHGTVVYAKGEEVVLFIEGIARSAELGGSRVAEHVRWVSRQESGAKFALDESTRQAIPAAVRAYVSLDALPPGQRPDALRRLTVEMLGSPHEVIASSALRDVVLAGDAPFFAEADQANLELILDAPETPIGIRIGLLAELERRGLVVGEPRWAAMLRTTSGPERLIVVRAAGAHPSPAVSSELSKLLLTGDSQLVAAAAVSLGSPGNDAAVPPLTGLLEKSDSRVRMAAIRGLGRVGSAKALVALETAAASHADPATRRRAAAEVKILSGRTPSESRVRSTHSSSAEG
jgi:hypothetical protein